MAPNQSHAAENAPTSPPRTPTNEIPPCWSASESPGVLARRGREIELEKNNLVLELRQVKRKLADITDRLNSSGGDGQGNTERSVRPRRDNQPDADGIDDSQELDTNINIEVVHRTGRAFGLLKCIFLKGGPFAFSRAIDDQYDEAQRRTSTHMKAQGQLRDILDVLPEHLRERYSEEWLARAFLNCEKGLLQQAQNIKKRLRTECWPIFDVPAAEATDFKSAVYREQFREKIGFKNNKYNTLDAEILHDKSYKGKFDLRSWMRGEVPKKLYVALIRGTQSALDWKAGRRPIVNGVTNERLYGIRNITPESLANIAVLTIWTLSVDSQLNENGDTTGINYYELYEDYLSIIQKNLRLKTVAMRETMRMWDDEIFPGTTSSVVRRPAREGSTNNEVDQILAGIEDEEVEQSDEEDGSGRSGTQDDVEED